MTHRRLGVSAAFVDGALVPGDVGVSDGLITSLGLPAAQGSRIAAPGLIDLQVNGFAGIDLMTADVEDVHRLARSLLRHGVTAWLPTLITAAPDQTNRALDVLAQVVPARPGGWTHRGALPLGVHLEGPFISAQRLGTHPAAHRRDPDLAQVEQWRERAPVVAVTVAPELPGALQLVHTLDAAGVLVSVGHSNATSSQAHAAFDAGARTVTHLFNAMSPLRHRKPGVPGAALARADVTIQLVVDGHHLDPDVVKVAWAAAQGRVALVTDATAAAGRDDGTYALSGVSLNVRGGAVRNEQGALAGSALTLDTAVRNACELGVGVEAALSAVTETPARLLRRSDIGRLAPGLRADFVVLEEDLTVRDTYLGGDPVDRSVS